MEQLPKLLKSAISELLQEKNLQQWNIQANGDSIVYINMRFVSPGLEMNTPVPVGFRKKSPSEKRRDSCRMSSWQNSKTQTEARGKYENATVYNVDFVKGPESEQCYSACSEDNRNPGHESARKSDPLVKNINKDLSSTECNSDLGQEIDSSPYMACTSTNPQQNENIDLPCNDDELPKATGIHSTDYDLSSLFRKIVINDSNSKLFGLSKHNEPKIAIYDLTEDLQQACDTFQLITPDSESYEMYKQYIASPNKDNIMHTCHDRKLRKHLDNMYEMVRDYAIYNSFRKLSNILKESTSVIK